MTATEDAMGYTAYSSPPGGQVIWILHGILGSRRNWAGFARQLALACPHLQIGTADLRNHGDAPRREGPHTWRETLADLRGLADALGYGPDLLIGHSFGGRVALRYAQQILTLREVWTLDTAFGSPRLEVQTLIEACRRLPTNLTQRGKVIAYFTKRGYSPMLAQWMTTNIKRGADGRLGWRCNLDGIEAMWADECSVRGEALLARFPNIERLHCLWAERSDLWTPALLAQLQRQGVQLHRLPEAGHWVHIDQPHRLLQLLTQHFSQPCFYSSS